MNPADLNKMLIEPPLHLAVKLSQHECATVLLEAGACPDDVSGPDEMTALMHAISSGREQVAVELVNKMDDFGAKNP